MEVDIIFSNREARDWIATVVMEDMISTEDQEDVVGAMKEEKAFHAEEEMEIPTDSWLSTK